MEINLPINTADSITWTMLHNVGFFRNIAVDVIQYSHAAYGGINLRAIDSSTTEILFFNPNYPRLKDILPLFHYVRIEGDKELEGIEYPEDVKKKLNEEYNRRMTVNQSLLASYIKKLQFEEQRYITQCKYKASPQSPGYPLPKQPPTVEDIVKTLSDDERKILSLWQQNYPASDIGGQVSMSPGRVLNIVTGLRKRLGEDLVPYHRK